MRARLVQIDDQNTGPRAVFALEGAALVIGRELDADLRLDHPRVSRRHARLTRDWRGHLLDDLGSTNGTTLNGVPISGAVRLAPGDRIQLAVGVAFVYETRQPGPRALVLGCIATLVLLGSLLGYARATLRTDTGMEAAIASARTGIAAYRSEQWQQAAESFRTAARSLHTEHPLTGEESLRQIGARLDGDVDLVLLYRRATDAAHPSHIASAPCRLESLDLAAARPCVREHAERVLSELWQSPADVPERFYDAIQKQVVLLATQRRSWLEEALERGGWLSPMLARELEAQHLPSTLRYLALIESGYDPHARSPAGALGLWQLLAGTARDNGLRIDGGRDERADPRKATRAAARYLNALAFEFGSDALLLVIAAYNAGENRVRGALRKLDDPRTERTYWSLVDRGLLPSETEAYVPRFVAAAILGEAGLPSATPTSVAEAAE